MAGFYQSAPLSREDGGYTAERIAERLKKAGGNLIEPPEGIYMRTLLST